MQPQPNPRLGRPRKLTHILNQIRLTPRDFEILKYLYDQKFCSLECLYYRFFDGRNPGEPVPIHMRVARQRLQILKRAEFIRSQIPFILSGLTFCGHCGDSLSGKSAHGNGGKIPYYEHAWATRRQACLTKKVFDHEPRRVLAKKLESRVWEEVLTLLQDPKVGHSLIEQAHKIHRDQGPVKEGERLKGKVQGITEQIEALAEHLSKIPKGLSPAPIFAQMQKLDELKTKTVQDMEDLERKELCRDLPMALKDYQAFLKTLESLLKFAEGPELRAKIVRRLIYRVEVEPKLLRIHYYVGQGKILSTDWEERPRRPASKVL